MTAMDQAGADATGRIAPIVWPPRRRAASKPHLVDATMLFAPRSGGVKRYLLAKQAWLKTREDVRHTLVVPGAITRLRRGALSTIAAARLPFGDGTAARPTWPNGCGRWPPCRRI
jgi:hypothetical protein